MQTDRSRYYSFILESAWRSEKVNTTEWLQQWGTQRCGAESAAAREAWALLASTVYADSQAAVYEHHMGYCPTTMPDGSGWDRQKGAERPKWYNHTDLYDAWGLLIAAAEGCPESDAFTFDLVDVGREWLSITPCNDAYDALMNASTPQDLTAANATMSEVMSDLDRLLASSSGFLLGQWIADARKLAESAGSPQDSDFMEWNARSQVTSWFPVQGTGPDCEGTAAKLDGLWDYGNKAWAGLVHGYYDRRYQLYADSKMRSLLRRGDDGNDAEEKEQVAYIASVMRAACEFGHETGAALPSTPTGDALSIAKELYQKYHP